MNYFYFCLENEFLNENESSEVAKEQENPQEKEDLVNEKTEKKETIEEELEQKGNNIEEIISSNQNESNLIDSEKNTNESSDLVDQIAIIEGEVTLNDENKNNELELNDNKIEESVENDQEEIVNENHLEYKENNKKEIEDKETNLVENKNENKKEEVREENNSFIFLCCFIISFLIYQIITSSFLNALMFDKYCLKTFDENKEHNFYCSGFCAFNIIFSKFLKKSKFLLTISDVTPNTEPHYTMKEQNKKYYLISYISPLRKEITEEEFNKIQLYGPWYSKTDSESYQRVELKKQNVNKVIHTLFIILTTISYTSLRFIIESKDLKLNFLFTKNKEEEKTEKEEASRDKFFLLAFYLSCLQIILFVLSLIYLIGEKGILNKIIYYIIQLIFWISNNVFSILVLIYSIFYFKEILEKEERTKEEKFLMYSLSIYYFLVLLSILFFGKRTLSWLLRRGKDNTELAITQEEKQLETQKSQKIPVDINANNQNQTIIDDTNFNNVLNVPYDRDDSGKIEQHS